MKPSSFLPTVASFAILCGLAGCGGSSSFGGDRAVLVVGGAEGMVFDHLKKSQNVSHVGMGADLATADIIVLDGDHISPGMLGSLRGLRAAAQSGTPVILTDASAELASSVADEIGCPSAPGDSSLAVGFALLPGEGDEEASFQVFEIPAGSLGVESRSVTTDAGGTSVGPTSSTQVQRVSSEGQVQDMLAALHPGGASSGLVIQIPPREVKHFLVTYTYSEGNVANKELNGQIDSSLVTHRFLGYLGLGPSEAKPYTQGLLQVSEGRSSVGNMVYSGAPVQAWSQSMVEMSTYIETQSGAGERFSVTTSPGLQNPGVGASVRTDYEGLYKDASGNVRQWQANIGQADLGIGGWQVNGGVDPANGGTRFAYSQTDPFDGLGTDYESGWSGSDYLIQPKPFPAASVRQLNMTLCPLYRIVGDGDGAASAVRGSVVLKHTLKRKYLFLQSVWWPGLEGEPGSQIYSGVEKLQGTDAHKIVLNFKTIAP